MSLNIGLVLKMIEDKSHMDNSNKMKNHQVIDKYYVNRRKSDRYDVCYPDKYLTDRWLGIEMVQFQFEGRNHLGN